MNYENEKNRLLQDNNLNILISEPKLSDMLTVYLNDVEGNSHNRGIHSFLLPLKMKDKALSDFSWDMQSTDGKPDSCIYGDGTAEYLRFGNDKGYEPLLIERDFNSFKDNYIEICEEFRLFHNLYHDTVNSQFIKIDNVGRSDIIATLKQDEIKIKVLELKQFLAIKEMCLIIQFDYKEYTSIELSKMNLEERHKIEKTDTAIWSIGYGDIKCGGSSIFSRLCGKKVLEPISKSKSGMYGFSENIKKEDIEFLVDLSPEGDEILSCALEGQKNYLVPIYFKKEVLDKYYQKPSIYSVEPSYIRCGNAWGIMIDNDQKDIVCVWLGDLNRDLPYEEKLHWRSYNIPPKGLMSKSFIRQQLFAEFTESQSIDHIFKSSYRTLRDISLKTLNIYLILPLKKDDMHYFETIRIPSTNEQVDFDNLILGLTKVLIDSLNEKYMNNYIKKHISEDNIKGSISKLEKIFELHHMLDYEKHITFLRNLQGLRSSSTAHRKGSNYEIAIQKFEINIKKDLRTGIEDILKQSCEFLEYLANSIYTGKLNFDKN